MSYLEDFTTLLQESNLSALLHLWEEYCMGDQVDGQELLEILKLFKDSQYAQAFGRVVEAAMGLWERIKEEEIGDNVLRLILDLQTTQTPYLADLATHFLSTHYKHEPDFSEKMRIIGLRARQRFQGAITNYELLSHMQREKFVFHTGGWGVGEVLEISLLQEHASIEFEGVAAIKDLSFDNVFKNLVFLPADHFLARRFGNPDLLEEEGRKDPALLIRHLLRDLGPKTAQEIKEELVVLVIPEEEWSKWWQATRSKIKKDTKIKSPEDAKGAFSLQTVEIKHEDRLKEALKEKLSIELTIDTIYHYLRDFPEVMRREEIKELAKEKLLAVCDGGSVAQKLQISFLLEDIYPEEFSKAAETLIQSVENVESLIFHIDILAFKKRLLVLLRKARPDWEKIFLHLLFGQIQNILRDYIFKELLSHKGLEKLVGEKVQELLHNMTLYPEAFFWYFQKLIAGEKIPYQNEASLRSFLEGYLVLMHYIDDKPEYHDLLKKMHNLLIAKRFEVVRTLIEGASVAYLQEFLLLTSKCHCFSKHEQRVLQSLAEVVQPSIAKAKEEEPEEIIWTTAEGYERLKKRVQEIGTVEMIDNAKEIEAARALGDLRENSEYKFALERRSRLQSELQTLSRQLNLARILTERDVSPSEVGPGAVVQIKDASGKESSYTLLGPWDADPEKNILSCQSKFAQAMLGHKKGESFDFQGMHYEINSIQSYLS